MRLHRPDTSWVLDAAPVRSVSVDDGGRTLPAVHTVGGERRPLASDTRAAGRGISRSEATGTAAASLCCMNIAPPNRPQIPAQVEAPSAATQQPTPASLEAKAVASAKDALDSALKEAETTGDPDFRRLDVLRGQLSDARDKLNATLSATERARIDRLLGRVDQPAARAPLPFDRSSPPSPGTSYVNPATGQLVVADPKPNDTNTRISPMGNTYQVIGAEKVAEMKKDPHMGVLMEGYEEAIANTSTTYVDAQYRLGQEVKEIRASARGSNWKSESPEGRATEAKAQALIKTWDPVAGTYAGYDPAISAAKFAIEDRAAGLTLDGVISLRRERGLDEDGYLLEGFDHLKVRPTGYEGLTQRQAREKAFLDYFPLGTEEQLNEMLLDPRYNRGPHYQGFEINAIGSPGWGTGRWAEHNAKSAQPRPPELGKAMPWRYGEG